MKNIEKTIKSRHSVREFTDKQIDKELEEKLNDLIKELHIKEKILMMYLLQKMFLIGIKKE